MIIRCLYCGKGNNVPETLSTYGIYKCGNCKKQLNIVDKLKYSQSLCIKCNNNLYGKPKINVDGYIYCFRCAKQWVVNINDQRYRKAKDIFYIRKKEYDKRRTIYEGLRSEWHDKYIQFIEQGRIGFWPSVLVILFIGIMANQFDQGKGLGFLSVIASAAVWIMFSLKKTKKREAEFIKKSPEPIFGESEPIFEGYKEVKHFLMGTDGSSFKSNNYYRDEVLRRDNLECQKCGTKHRKDNLEVHHIIPVASKGLDAPTNLITLCIYCHDREDWYGHIRKYPTTMYTYVSTINSKIYHYDTCKIIKNKTENNLITFKSIKEVKEAGRSPCKVCNP
jgi:hypothetical protein